MNASGDYEFIVGAIEYLSSRHNVRFFISSGDFDLLYGWWEKKIPGDVIKIAMDRVVSRRRKRSLPIDSFSRFRYEVGRQHAAWLERGVGGHGADISTAGNRDPVEVFMERFPAELEPLRSQFESAVESFRNRKEVEVEDLRNRLVDLFRNDAELDMKVLAFMQNLAPELRSQSVERVYRANFLWNRFGIPDFAMLQAGSI